jgi:PTS system mannose-specific IIA component
MVGILVITHCNMAAELLRTAEFIVGGLEAIKGLSIDPQKDVESVRKEIEEAMKQVDRGEGILILTDMFGGTPSNISLSFLEEGKVEVLSGVNLPMLLKLSSHSRRNKSLKALAEEVQIAGQSSITLASKILNSEAR